MLSLVFTISWLFKAVLLFDALANDNVAVYWGQNTAGISDPNWNQRPLRHYCEDPSVDMVILAFANGFPEFQLNFANTCFERFSNGLLNCPEIGADIQHCQKLGKLVLLSLGGALGDYHLDEPAEARALAATLWGKFGAGSDTERPFGPAVVDGFDFNFERPVTEGLLLATELKRLFGTDPTKRYYLSAAPQCLFPDEHLHALLERMHFDFLFVQFYNNDCLPGPDFNYADWYNHALAHGPTKVYVGLLGDAADVEGGFADIPAIAALLTPELRAAPEFGGVMIWDASTADANRDLAGESYQLRLKTFLTGVAGGLGSPSYEDTDHAPERPSETNSDWARPSGSSKTEPETDGVDSAMPSIPSNGDLNRNLGTEPKDGLVGAPESSDDDSERIPVTTPIDELGEEGSVPDTPIGDDSKAPKPVPVEIPTRIPDKNFEFPEPEEGFNLEHPANGPGEMKSRPAQNGDSEKVSEPHRPISTNPEANSPEDDEDKEDTHSDPRHPPIACPHAPIDSSQGPRISPPADDFDDNEMDELSDEVEDFTEIEFAERPESHGTNKDVKGSRAKSQVHNRPPNRFERPRRPIRGMRNSSPDH